MASVIAGLPHSVADREGGVAGDGAGTWHVDLGIQGQLDRRFFGLPDGLVETLGEFIEARDLDGCPRLVDGGGISVGRFRLGSPSAFDDADEAGAQTVRCGCHAGLPLTENLDPVGARGCGSFEISDGFEFLVDLSKRLVSPSSVSSRSWLSSLNAESAA